MPAFAKATATTGLRVGGAGNRTWFTLCQKASARVDCFSARWTSCPVLSVSVVCRPCPPRNEPGCNQKGVLKKCDRFVADLFLLRQTRTLRYLFTREKTALEKGHFCAPFVHQQVVNLIRILQPRPRMLDNVRTSPGLMS